jgi:hypothetical protein
MKHITFKNIGKKLFALSMAAIASVSLMLAAAPTASAINTAEYTPDDYFIQLPAPIYNWKNSNKVLKFKVRKKQLGSGTDQAAMRLVDKNGYYRTNFTSYTFLGSGVATNSHGVTMAPILYSGGWYECTIPVKNLPTFPYQQNLPYYQNPSQSGRQTLLYLENRGYYYKDFEITETVDPDRNVTRFHVNQLNLSQPTKDSVEMWKYSNKKIIFDFRPTNAHNYGSDNVTLYLQTITETGSWKSIASSIKINVVAGTTTLPGATVQTLSNGWKHIELPLNKFTANYSQISNPEIRTLDVVGFDWVNHSFEMRNFRIA